MFWLLAFIALLLALLVTAIIYKLLQDLVYRFVLSALNDMGLLWDGEE